jgi:hypothetical protein
MLRLPLPAALLLATLAVLLPPSASAEPYAVEIPSLGALRLDFPAGWKASTAGAPATVTVELPGGLRAKLTPLYNPRLGEIGDGHARGFAQAMTAQLAEGAEEPTLELQVVEGGAHQVFWFGATDKAPKPGEWKRVTMGTAAVGGKVMLVFTLLHDPPAPPERGALLQVVAGARLVLSEPAAAPKP